MKRKTKTPKQKLITKMDDLWREIIHSKGSCEICGRTTGLNAHHLVSRTNTWLRWDLRNGCLLCVEHHFGRHSAHKESLKFSKWFIENRSGDFEYLNDSRWEQTKTWKMADYEQIYQELKEVINDTQRAYGRTLCQVYGRTLC